MKIIQALRLKDRARNDGEARIRVMRIGRAGVNAFSAAWKTLRKRSFSIMVKVPAGAGNFKTSTP
jgi:hypothetical protein